MYYVVTGAAGFIGSNLVRALNARGERQILAVDDLQRGDKFRNLVECEIADFLDKDEFRTRLAEDDFSGSIDAVFHEGACSDTMETDGRFMMENNYRYSMALLEYCLEEEVPLIYASSAAVYGASTTFREDRRFEEPLNIYGYSKFLFDQAVRQRLADAGTQVDSATSTSTAPMNGTRGEWRRLPGISSINIGRSSEFDRSRGPAVTGTANSVAISFRWRMWSR